MDGAVLEALVFAMYGEHGVDVGHLVAPLFVAADALQVMEPEFFVNLVHNSYTQTYVTWCN